MRTQYLIFNWLYKYLNWKGAPIKMLGANQRCELGIKSELLYLYLHILSYIFITKKGSWKIICSFFDILSYLLIFCKSTLEIPPIYFLIKYWLIMSRNNDSYGDYIFIILLLMEFVHLLNSLIRLMIMSCLSTDYSLGMSIGILWAKYYSAHCRHIF